jgi:hypothetical protein
VIIIPIAVCDPASLLGNIGLVLLEFLRQFRELAGNERADAIAAAALSTPERETQQDCKRQRDKISRTK